MWRFAICLLAIPTAHLGAAEIDAAKILPGPWQFTSNQHSGDAEIRVAKDGKIEGTMFGHLVVGTYDPADGKVQFKRKLDANDTTGRQDYTGVLTRHGDSRSIVYQLEGTFTSPVGGSWGKDGVEYPWFAHAKRVQPAEDLKELQGKWVVKSIVPSYVERNKLPEELGLNAKGSAFSIEGNQVLRDGKAVTTLANDLSSPALEAEKGFPYNRLLLLTMPDGRGLLCSYTFLENGVEIAYPHTTFCHRGSGQIIKLERPKE